MTGARGWSALKTRLVLLGGTGFFGAALAQELRDRGHTVVTVARGTRGAPDVRADIVRTPQLLEQVFEPGDTVIYLLGLSPLKRPFGGRSRYREVHLDGVVGALAAAWRRGASRFVQVSALGVSRDCGAAYGETKARATAELRAEARAARIEGLVVEPSILFGDGSEIVRALDLASHFPVVPLPHITAAVRPIHVTDAARRLADAVTAGQMPPRLELTGPELLPFSRLAAAYLKPRGTRVLLLPQGISRLLVRLVSRFKVPGLPAELEAMLAMDNAGEAPPRPEELIAFTRWAAGAMGAGRLARGRSGG